MFKYTLLADLEKICFSLGAEHMGLYYPSLGRCNHDSSVGLNLKYFQINVLFKKYGLKYQPPSIN